MLFTHTFYSSTGELLRTEVTEVEDIPESSFEEISPISTTDLIVSALTD